MIKPKITEEEAMKVLKEQQLLFTQLGMTISDYINARLTGRSMHEVLIERATKEDLTIHQECDMFQFLVLFGIFYICLCLTFDYKKEK